MLLASLILAAGGLMLLYFQTKERPLALLSGLSIGLAGWTKNEGLVAVVGFTLVWLLMILKSANGVDSPTENPREFAAKALLKENSKALGYYVAGLAFPIIVVILFKIFLAPPNDLLSQQGNLFDKLLDIERYTTILKQALVTLWNLGDAPLSFFGIIILTAIILGRSSQRVPGLWIIPVFVGIQLAAYFGTFLVTPQDLPWHLSTSLDRLYLHVFPLALCWFFLWLRSPEELSSKES